MDEKDMHLPLNMFAEFVEKIVWLIFGEISEDVILRIMEDSPKPAEKPAEKPAGRPHSSEKMGSSKKEFTGQRNEL